MRALLGVRYHELPEEHRSTNPAPSTDLGADEVRDHLRRLQDHGLLEPTGTLDIERQATTEAARELWPAWTYAVIAADDLGLHQPQERTASMIEAVLRVAGTPAAVAAVQQIADPQARREDLAAALRAGAAEQLADLLPAAAPRRLDGPIRSVRHPAPATTALTHLTRMYEAFGAWHRDYFPTDRRTAAVSTSRTRTATATFASTAAAPEITAGPPRAPQR